ncbi:MAG TPA: hypothetical protein VFQ44_29325, partial [Streptosporangiaceae bacterium]|nr:hypothetical protein [Streptosporangiaceae bacterium]
VESVEHATSITESDGVGGVEPEDVLVAAGLTDNTSLPEPEAVPFKVPETVADLPVMPSLGAAVRYSLRIVTNIKFTRRPMRAGNL